uniref:HNH endonuclease n=1 Tax=Altererythrobacter segetis TaxID=1104773 RepID=UPI00140AD69B|nr:HNH endonuclease signature motif containing protein [Altererythrobacter segetis]
MAKGEIISYFDMCQREGTSLQRGMNFRLRGRHSVILMSRRPNALYADRIEEDGTVLVYEGHDEPKTADNPMPKLVDQPEFLPSGRPTENGKFAAAARQFKAGMKGADIVRVYEKLHKGIWSDNGYFQLVDSWCENDGRRDVFKFKLVAVDIDEDDQQAEAAPLDESHRRRIIPSVVKQEVWKRDRARCVRCGATDELHFDHVVPFSKGGTSLTAENVQLLCARHNLQKSANIE